MVDFEIDSLGMRLILVFVSGLSKFKVGSIDKKSKYGRRFDNQKSLGEMNIPKLSDLLELTSNNISDDLIINLEI